MQLEQKSNYLPCLLNHISPPFGITALAAWMNINGGGDFSSNNEVEFPHGLWPSSIFSHSVFQNRGYNSDSIIIAGEDNVS